MYFKKHNSLLNRNMPQMSRLMISSTLIYLSQSFTKQNQANLNYLPQWVSEEAHIVSMGNNIQSNISKK